MRTRKLGQQGLEVSAIGLGCMGMSTGYGECDEGEAIATITRALDLGINLLNTSDNYAGGANEELIGRAIRGRRDEVILTTKFGQVGGAINGKPEYVLAEYSLWTRDVEEEILPVCRDLGIGFVAYAPLGRGFLTGTIKKADDLIESDRRHVHPRFAPENIAKNLELLKAVEGIAYSRGFRTSQVALAWLLARGEDIVPIPGTKRRKYLQENSR